MEKVIVKPYLYLHGVTEFVTEPEITYRYNYRHMLNIGRGIERSAYAIIVVISDLG